MEHPIANPRRVIVVGVVFASLSVIYLLFSHDAGGSTMIAFLAVAMTLMSYVLVAGSPRG